MTQNIYNQVSTFVAPDSESARLYDRVKQRLHLGESEQQRLIDQVGRMVIRDKLVPPTGMQFTVPAGGKAVRICYNGSEETLKIHRHALNQLAAKVNVPMTYVNHLQGASLSATSDKAREQDTWKSDLLAYILTTSFHQTEFTDRSGEPRFLHRIVDGELRGFLSRRFNRHLASAPLLRAFLNASAEMQAFPMQATTTDVKLALKCYLPYVFEPVKGEFVCLGCEWTNSDFGAGRMQVALTMWLPGRDRFTVLDQALSRVHIGSVIEDSDIELSEETATKEAETQALAVRDSVKTQLAVESVEKVLKAIEVAHIDAVPWHRIRGNLAKYIGKKDIDNLHEALKKEILDLPPVPKVDGEVHASKWWASNALSWLASKEQDPEKQLELQHAAGSFLEVK